MLYRNNPELLSSKIWPFSGGGHYNDPPYHAEFDIAKDFALSQTEWHLSRRDVGIYQLTREKVLWDQLESVSVLIGGMKCGDSCLILLGSITAFATEAKEVLDPIVYCNNQPVRICGALPLLTYVEWRDGDTVAFDSNGKAHPEISIQGIPEILHDGENTLTSNNTGSRLYVTVGLKK